MKLRIDLRNPFYYVIWAEQVAEPGGAHADTSAIGHTDIRKRSWWKSISSTALGHRHGVTALQRYQPNGVLRIAVRSCAFQIRLHIYLKRENIIPPQKHPVDKLLGKESFAEQRAGLILKSNGGLELRIYNSEKFRYVDKVIVKRLVLLQLAQSVHWNWVFSPTMNQIHSTQNILNFIKFYFLC